MDSQIQAVIAAYVEDPIPKHQPFVSKKKKLDACERPRSAS
jgi:hypothetical protein